VGTICRRKVIKLTVDDNIYDAMQLFDLLRIEGVFLGWKARKTPGCRGCSTAAT
jgi:hypothetical protein